MNQPHIHGGNPEHNFERLGIPQYKVLDFSVNVSPLGPPRIIYKNWNRLGGEIVKYPSLDGNGVSCYYEKRFDLNKENILSGNGSSECLYLVPRALGFSKVGIITPSFYDYERSCRLTGAKIIEMALSQENSFSAHEYEHLAECLKQVDALILGNPNNPTCTLYQPEILLKLAKQFPEKWILVDEAFIQFVDNCEERSLIRPDRIRRNLLIFHSLTKFYDIPGIRLGCVIGHPKTIQTLKKVKEPWTINGIAEKTASLLINCDDYENQLIRLIRKEKERFFNNLDGIDGIRLYPSETNFILAQWTASKNLDDLLRILLSNGLHVRDCRNFRQLEDNFFRFAIRKGVENIRLISQIKRALLKVKK